MGGRGPKVGCSIKLVDQRHGTDLDPHNVKWQPRGESPQGPSSRGPIQASADVKQGGNTQRGPSYNRSMIFLRQFKLASPQVVEKRGVP